MAHSEALDRLVARIASQVRWRRAEHYALRGFFYGTLVGAVALLLKVPLGRAAIPVALGAAIVGLIAGAICGLARRIAPADAARLADQAFGLQDRVATALEWSTRPDRTPLVEALVADATEKAGTVELRQIVRRVLPREARWLPAPLALAVVLAIAPALPLPTPRLPDLSPGADTEEAKERGDTGLMEQDRRTATRDPLRRPSMEERDFAQRAGGTGSSTTGDLSAIFKDTSLGNQRPDFNSFLKKGDDRLKMLEQADRLPDLQSDFTQSQYKMMFRKTKALSGGLRGDQMTPQKIRELLEEMERLGRKGGNWGGDVSEGMEALEGGQPDRAMEAMQKALDKLRAQEESQRGGKNLRGGREGDRGTASRDRNRGGGSGGADEQDFGEGEGLLPGKGRSGAPKGEASQRLRANPYDVGVEGESRRGRKDGYDTNMTGRGGQMPSRLQYLGVVGQYRKMMEDSIAREQVPRDFHTQIRNYFQALDER
ncbi:MAG: hypothetical protein HY216_12155 [Candidatus Rokubacteria bacterium]|nr:hypothetical protein [Candidatus Rokubacteria bacterium]